MQRTRPAFAGQRSLAVADQNMALHQVVGPAWAYGRAQLRRRWTSAVVIALLVGTAGGVVLTAYAGARRTDTAYPRYLTATHAADFLISTGNSGTPATNTFYRHVEALPQVQRSGVLFGPSLLAVSRSGQLDLGGPNFVQTYASEDGRAGYTVDSLKLLTGRMPRPGRPYEAAANRTLALRWHLRIGSTFKMFAVNTNASAATAPQVVRHEKPLTFTITGIGVSYDEVVPVASNDGLPTLFLTPAYYLAHHTPAETNFDGVAVQLRPGASHSAFDAATTAAWGAAGGQRALNALFVADLTQHYARVERAIKPDGLVLELFALFVAIGALVAIGDVLAREVQLSSVEHPTLRALGFDQGQLVATAMLWLTVPVVVGALLSVVGAAMASPLMPIGAARLAEPRPGLAINFSVLGFGFGALVIMFCGLSLLVAWLVSRSSIPGKSDARVVAARPWRGAETLGRAGFPPSAVNGLSMAIASGRSKATVPVRSAIIGAVLAVASIVGAVTFGANLDRLVSTPALYGVTWNAGLDDQFGALSRAQVLAATRQLAGVTGVAAGAYGGDVSIDGVTVPAVGIDSLRGSLFPTIVKGRRPVGPGEIGLGAETMRQLEARLGDWVTLRAGLQSRRLKVVGEVVFPSFGEGSFTPTDLGEGAITTSRIMAQTPGGPNGYNFVLLRFSRRAVPAGVAALTRIAARGGCEAVACIMTPRAMLPTDVKSYEGVKATPLYLAGILSFFGAAMIGHALVTSVRRRRRELALLKTLGLSTRQVAASVAWQASAFAAIGLVVGLPAGVLLGRWLWQIFASEVGVPGTSIFPLKALLVVPVVLILANLIAAVPGQSAAHTRVAHVLRAE